MIRPWFNPLTGLAVIGLLLVWAVVRSPEPTTAEPEPGTIALPDLGSAQWPLCAGADGQAHCVIDGDTFRFEGARHRLACTNAPEPDAASDDQRFLSSLATRYLARALADQRTLIVPTGLDDPFGRPLVTLAVEQRGGRLLSLEADMVTFGLAEIGGWPNTQTFCQRYRVM